MMGIRQSIKNEIVSAGFPRLNGRNAI